MEKQAFYIGKDENGAPDQINSLIFEVPDDAPASFAEKIAEEKAPKNSKLLHVGPVINKGGLNYGKQ
ncbi:MAG TPA: hypothetical protein P5323_02740 [Candidatus Moranbacteria bacterium]|nr:hypothetical protein [Candidatus Moranbacteria bacterium]HRY28030.1 hypothetical protein [Candidatus Moranbacteria bacterium]HSA07895.1 hypothetical protein [Candidatus Moranbacteria bacterium]